jgi:hypothetical protein
MNKAVTPPGARLAWVQFAYMTHQPLRARDTYLYKLCRNIEDLGIGHKLEIQLMALALAAWRKSPSVRQDLCGRALGALEILWPGLAPPKAGSGK